MIKICLAVVLLSVTVMGQSTNKRVKQPRDVVEAYRVCAEFQRLVAEDLDFDRAFEATFTKDPARRREIAIADDELGDVDYTQIDDATLLSIYKDQNQLFFLLMSVIDSKDTLGKAILFPPAIDETFERLKQRPKDLNGIQAYAEQLHRDIAALRVHVNQLAAKYPSVAEGIRKFKESLAQEPTPPNAVVKPLTAYSKGKVLGLNEKYYQIDSFAVIREGEEMKIIGIRLFTRLF
jgi:hypothetical protein